MIGSLVFVDALTQFQLESGDAIDPLLRRKIEIRFGSVSTGMLALLQSTTGGVDWGEIFDIVQNAGKFYGLLFVLFVIFFIFALFNIVTSVFVEKIAKLAQPDFDQMMLEHQQVERQRVKALTKVLRSASTDRSGLVNFNEMKKLMKNS